MYPIVVLQLEEPLKSGTSTDVPAPMPLLNLATLGWPQWFPSHLTLATWSSSMNIKAESAKSFQTTSLCYSIPKSTLSSADLYQGPLTFIKVKITEHENLYFVHFSLLTTHNLKIIRCMRLLCMPNDFSTTAFHFNAQRVHLNAKKVEFVSVEVSRRHYRC